MEIKKLANNALNFCINRFIEIFGISIVLLGALLLISFISFSPDDPNFIFPENAQIKNFLGYRGSYSADLFFQSFGLTALLIPFGLILSSYSVKTKMSKFRKFISFNIASFFLIFLRRSIFQFPIFNVFEILFSLLPTFWYKLCCVI